MNVPSAPLACEVAAINIKNCKRNSLHMIPSQSISKTMAQVFSNLKYEEIPDKLRLQLKSFFLDWIASVFAGADQPSTRAMLSLVGSMGESSEATTIPTKSKNSSLMAALVNGASSHVVEMDDLHRQSVFHPGASILPAVFAAAEKMHASGRDLLLGILTGYETGIRTALAVGRTHYERWHTTATCGTFGAAAGAAKILHLDVDPFVWALGSAGTQSSGLWEFLTESAMSKQLHCGKASMNGLLAALLAQRGFTGPARIYEGNKGFLRATSDDPDFEILTNGLGEVFHTEKNSLKYYASCGHTHTAIEAALQVKKDANVCPKSIRSITVSIYKEALDLLKDTEANTPYLAKFNIPFCVATALCFGHVDLNDFVEERLNDQELIRLMSITSLKEAPELTGLYPHKWAARVEVEVQDEKRYEGYCEHPKGDFGNPLSQDELIGKFNNLCGEMLTNKGKNMLAGLIFSLEKIDDVTTIFQG